MLLYDAINLMKDMNTLHIPIYQDLALQVANYAAQARQIA